jgi:hypothetical protein
MRKFLLTLVSIVSLGVIVGCGGGSSNTTPVPSGPTGGNNVGFTTASLKGTYVFAANGINSSNSLAVVGTFTADGTGNIATGSRDTINDTRGQVLGESISGSYKVNQDGRGQMTLTGSSGQSIYPFVLSSPSAGKLFQDSASVDAVGRFELQPSAVPALSSGTSTYVIRLMGEDPSQNPYAAVGGLTVTAGTTLTGTIDENDSGTFNQQLPATGTLTLTSATGTMSYTTTNSSTQTTHDFAVFYVSPSRLELISTDASWFLYGYADLQTTVSASTSAFTGNQVLNLSGFDVLGPLEETGRLYLDGAGNVSNAIKDYNEDGTLYQDVGLNGTYSITGASTPGRWTASLTANSGAIVNENLVGWQVSPQQSLVLADYGANPSISNYSLLETGDMRTQTIGLSNGNVKGNYAQFFEGYDFGGVGNFESTGNYLADGNGNLSGTIDFQTDTQGFTQNRSQSSTYAVDNIFGRGTATVSGVPVIFYTVDDSTIYMISSDAAAAYQGTLTLQTAP